MLHPVCNPFSFLSLIWSFHFCSWCHWKIIWRSKERTKKQIWYLLVYKTILLDENFHSIPAFTDTTNSRVCVVEFEWNKRALFTPFFLIWFLWKKSIVLFWELRETWMWIMIKIFVTGLFGGHSLLLCYMHIYENLLFFICHMRILIWG